MAALRSLDARDAQRPVAATPRNGRHDSAEKRRAVRSGRQRGCYVYIAAEQLAAAGIDPGEPVPFYKIWSGQRGRFIVTLYPAPPESQTGA